MFHVITEEYYSSIVGGVKNRSGFVAHNASRDIKDVLIAYDEGVAVGCAAFKKHSESDAEIKRVWVQPDYRGKHIASELMRHIEDRMRGVGFKRAILQTREIMKDAVRLYEKLGYLRIECYPPYDELEGAVCFAKYL